MASESARKLFQDYVNAATDLAESVKRNIVKDGIVDDKTVNKLNDFMIATNNLANMQDDDLESEEDADNEKNESDIKLN